jgi:hypothetical protein
LREHAFGARAQAKSPNNIAAPSALLTQLAGRAGAGVVARLFHHAPFELHRRHAAQPAAAAAGGVAGARRARQQRVKVELALLLLA